MSRNDELAAQLETFADLLEARDVAYKPRAYRRAAENIRDHQQPIEERAANGAEAVAEIDAVGEAISGKVIEYIETGSIEELEQLREELPVEMDTLTRIEGVGPKTVGTLYEELGVQTLDDLEAAAEAGEIQSVKGFGPKTEQNIREGIEFARQASKRQLLGEALPRGESIKDHLSARDAVEQCELAGSIRRYRATIGDVDVLVGSTQPEAVIDAFREWREAATIIEAGTSKASLRIDGVRIDLRVVDPTEFGAALQYFTGSKDHNVALRNRAIDRELKMNEYGVFDVSEIEDAEADQRVGERIAGERETRMYEVLDLDWIPPELRENRGEIAAAAAGELPELVTLGELRGDLHLHTDWSDGNNTIEEMATQAATFGHEYSCVTDHATGPGTVAGTGLDDDRLREQLATIRKINETVDIELFAGVEANIGTDGTVSVGDDLLADLDLVVASPHAGLDGDGTDRLVSAIEHPGVDIIGHPTGRRLTRRSGLDVDIERLATAAARTGTALEINANPQRLDLSGRAVQTAIEAGATIAINTDAHQPASYEFLRYGIHTARRGWAEAGDILNTRDVSGIRSFLN